MVKDFRDLYVYQAAYDAAMQIFESSKMWPSEERYALTDQIRRSSRSVCANVAEAWCKRRYEPHFVSKLSDAESEAAETQNWLSFAADCGYLPPVKSKELDNAYNAIRAGLVRMMASAKRWCGPSTLREPDLAYLSELGLTSGTGK
jgi:four helix bundle protein